MCRRRQCLGAYSNIWKPICPPCISLEGGGELKGGDGGGRGHYGGEGAALEGAAAATLPLRTTHRLRRQLLKNVFEL